MVVLKKMNKRSTSTESGSISGGFAQMKKSLADIESGSISIVVQHKLIWDHLIRIWFDLYGGSEQMDKRSDGTKAGSISSGSAQINKRSAGQILVLSLWWLCTNEYEIS